MQVSSQWRFRQTLPHWLCGCACMPQGVKKVVRVCVYIKSLQSNNFLLTLTVFLNANLIKKQCKPLIKALRLISVCISLVQLLKSVIFQQVCRRSLPPFPLMHVHLYPSIPTCILFHLSFISPLTNPSYPHFLLLFFPDLLSYLWVVGLQGPCYQATIQTSLSWEARDKRDGQQADRWQKLTRDEDRLTAWELLQLDWQAQGTGKKNYNWMKDIQRGSTETLKRVVWQEDRDSVS